LSYRNVAEGSIEVLFKFLCVKKNFVCFGTNYTRIGLFVLFVHEIILTWFYQVPCSWFHHFSRW